MTKANPEFLGGWLGWELAAGAGWFMTKGVPEFLGGIEGWPDCSEARRLRPGILVAEAGCFPFKAEALLEALSGL
jgi:hypothetical protein